MKFSLMMKMQVNKFPRRTCPANRKLIARSFSSWDVVMDRQMIGRLLDIVNCVARVALPTSE
jgi:hypothetical protein